MMYVTDIFDKKSGYWQVRRVYNDCNVSEWQNFSEAGDSYGSLEFYLQLTYMDDPGLKHLRFDTTILEDDFGYQYCYIIVYKLEAPCYRIQMNTILNL